MAWPQSRVQWPVTIDDHCCTQELVSCTLLLKDCALSVAGKLLLDKVIIRYTMLVVQIDARNTLVLRVSGLDAIACSTRGASGRCKH